MCINIKGLEIFSFFSRYFLINKYLEVANPFKQNFAKINKFSRHILTIPSILDYLSPI